MLRFLAIARLRLLLAALVLLGGGAFARAGKLASRTPAWMAAQKRVAFKRLLGNIVQRGPGAGAVIAAPAGNPEYQFHWVRDAAVVTHEVQDRIANMTTGKVQRRLLGVFRRYVTFSRRIATSAAAAGLGEPKFNLDGSPYVDPWGRPQNDSPALRAHSMLAFAEWSLQHEGAAFVREHLFQQGSRGGQLLRKDLDYVASHWRDSSYDIWEEDRGDHFYTRAVQSQSLRRGAELAEALGDHEAAKRYRGAADELRRELDTHWDARYTLIRATLNSTGKVQHKWTGLDSAVILAAIHTFGPHAPIDILDERVMATAGHLEDDFQQKYAVNHRRAENRQRALLIGRYPEDRYTGQPGQDRDEGGNPWVVTTHGFAEYYFRVAAALRAAETFEVTAANRPFLLAALVEPAGSARLAVGTRLRRGDPELDKLATAVFSKGDGFLEAVRDAFGNGVQTEQIERSSGEARGATELSWNYASFLSAMRARKACGDLTLHASR